MARKKFKVHALVFQCMLRGGKRIPVGQPVREDFITEAYSPKQAIAWLQRSHNIVMRDVKIEEVFE